jgi:hypothetical protein
LTDAEGLITSSGNWLVLGPFSNPFACQGDNGALLTNHIAPSFIHCQYPREGDTIEYDPAQSTSTGYVGPVDGGKPVWRVFDDGSPDGDLNFDADILGD